MPSSTMQAMVLDEAHKALRAAELRLPEPGPHQVLIKVLACGGCRTDLHIFDGELAKPKLPLVLGHEIVGRVEVLGVEVEGFAIGDRVGVPWLGFTDGTCPYCRNAQENLCDTARFTGYQINGGYASYTLADARYCFLLPENYSDAEAAPLLCAGLIGYRSLKMSGDAARLGVYGSAQRLISWRRWRAIRGARSLPSPGQGTLVRKTSRASLAHSGPAAPTSCRQRSSMRRSSSHRLER